MINYPKHKHRIVISIVLIIPLFIFFFRFFYPRTQLIITPDLGRSDILELSFPQKYFLWESLHKNELPIWNRYLGNGFPMLAEGQTGTFFLPNLVLFKILPAVPAYTIGILGALYSLGLGMFFLLTTFEISIPLSIFGAISIMFSGLTIPHFTHITLLQSFSLLPWMLWASKRLAIKPGITTLIIFSIILSQQIFAGFTQAVFISLLASTLFYIYYLWTEKHTFRNWYYFLGAILLGICMSSAQLLPSYEFLNTIKNRGVFNLQYATLYSFSLPHLSTLWNPYNLGNPQYNAYNFVKGNIFWENNCYIGLIPLLLLVLGYILKKLRTEREFLFLSGLLGFMVLLMLGFHSPLYILYSFWPFNLFRVPSRFIWVFVTVIIILSMKTGQYIFKHRLNHKILRIAFLVLCITQLYASVRIWWNYNITTNASIIAERPVFDSYLTDSTFLSIGTETLHNSYFFDTGWTKPEPYIFLARIPNSAKNLYWHIPSFSVTAGRQIFRQDIVDTLINSAIEISDTPIATISSQANKLFSIYGITSLVTTIPLHTDTMWNLEATASSDFGSLNLYRLNQSVPYAYLSGNILLATTKEKATTQLLSERYIPQKTVIVESNLPINTVSCGTVKTQIVSHTKYQFEVKNNQAQCLLVVNSLYYPGWSATVDGKETQIYPANISQKSVIVPVGDHTIIFIYKPLWLLYGIIISLLSYGVAFIVIFLHFLNVNHHIG